MCAEQGCIILGRGRGATKIKQDGVVRKIRNEHGDPVIGLPKALLELGIKLNQKVVVKHVEGKNPMGWEIVIKPHVPKHGEKEEEV